MMMMIEAPMWVQFLKFRSRAAQPKNIKYSNKMNTSIRDQYINNINIKLQTPNSKKDERTKTR